MNARDCSCLSPTREMATAVSAVIAWQWCSSSCCSLGQDLAVDRTGITHKTDLGNRLINRLKNRLIKQTCKTEIK